MAAKIKNQDSDKQIIVNLSPNEEQRAILKYRCQSRQTRILQVRAQETILAAKNAGEFRQRRKRDSLKLLQVLKEAWHEEQAKRKAALEADYVKSYNGIGQSHDAAQLVVQNSGALAERKAKEAEENELWGNLRFQRAVQEENARKKEFSEEKILAKDRRKVWSQAAEIERRRARHHASQAKSEAREEEKVVTEEEGTEKYPKFDINRKDIRLNLMHSRLPGAPGDYKDTYFHSRFSLFTDRASRGILDIDQDHNEAEIDAWEAAEAQMKNVEKEKEQKALLEEIWKRRKAERGHAAAARLQKIALLEKELAVELEEEQERKHQLQIIEDLTKTVHTPEYKPDAWKLLQLTSFPASKELGGDSQANIEDGSSKIPETEDTSCATESKDLRSGWKQERESVPIVVQSALPFDGSEMFAQEQEVSSNGIVEGRMDETDHKPVESVDAETKVVKAASTKEQQPLEDSKSSFHPSECKVHGLRIGGLSGKYKDKDKYNHGSAGSAKLPCCTPRSQLSGVTRCLKDARSNSKFPSLPSLSRKSGVRKGNKSPRKSEGEQAPIAHEDQEAIDYIKEFKTRSTVTEKDQARPSVNSTGEYMDKKSGLPLKVSTDFGYTSESTKNSPRKESNNWLSNILEKFPWWKCDTSSKGFSCPGVRKQEKADGYPKLGEQADRLYGVETASRVYTPRTKYDEESSQELHTTRKTLPFRLETLGSLNTLRDTDYYCEEQPIWSEARTKVVFSKEELEALKLELYGTLTGETISSHQKKIILGKEKVKQCSKVEPKPQGLNPSVFLHASKDSVQKTRSFESNKDQILKPQTRNGKSEHSGNPPHKFDLMKSVTRQENKILKEETKSDEGKISTFLQQDCMAFQKSPLTGERHDPQQRTLISEERNHGKKPSKKDCATQYNFAEFESMSNEEVFSKEAGEKEDKGKTSLDVSRIIRLQEQAENISYRGSEYNLKHNIVESSSVNEHEALDSSETCLEIKKEKAFNELASSHELAEELIRAWRAGQIGGDIRTAFQRAKRSSTQVSRKRRATTVEDIQAEVTTNYPETKQKLGQLREKINRPHQNSATKLRKWDVLTPHGDVSQEKKESTICSASKSRNMGKSATIITKVHGRPKTTNQPPKDECPLKVDTKVPEEVIDGRVQDLVPEARSLDFILGSLSAQVRELDERLQNVTACSIGTIDASFISTPGEHEEQETISNAIIRATCEPSADRDTEIPGTSCGDLQCCVGGDSERVATLCIHWPERERINRAKKDFPAPPESPLVSTKSSESLSSSQNHQNKCKVSSSETTETRLSASSPSSELLGQSPISSMGICLEDMTELMQEMNGSPACQKMRAQLLQDSFLQNLPRRGESGTGSVNQEDIEFRRSGEKFRKTDPSFKIKCHSGQEERGRASKFSFKNFADICSGKVEPTILEELGTSNAEKQKADGISISPTRAVCRSPSRKPGRISGSSLDLEIAMRLGGNEEHMLLSGSVDFSPWNTANLPDVFTSITDVGKGLNCVAPLGHIRCSKDGGAKLEQCHLKESSKYLLKNNEFKKKCRAFERKRLGRGKGKHKKSVRKPFNPLALPPKRIPSPRSSTRTLQATPQPGALKLSRRDKKLTKDSRSKLKLTSRSLPEDIPTSLPEEVKKWMRGDSTSCLAVLPDEFHGRKRRAVIKYPHSPGIKKPEGLVTSSDSLPQQPGRTSPPLVMTTPEEDRREPLHRRSLIKRDLEARRRPSSAGIVLSRR